MNTYFNRNRWWAIAFVVLLIMNIVTLASIWVMKEHGPQHAEQHRPEAAAFLVHELGFDAVQEERLLVLRDEHRHAMMELRSKTRNAKDSLFALLQQPSITDSVLQTAVYRASGNDRQMDILTFRHFQQIRALCTPAQKIKFDAVLQEVLRLMGPPMGERAGGPPPPGREAN